MQKGLKTMPANDKIAFSPESTPRKMCMTAEGVSVNDLTRVGGRGVWSCRLGRALQWILIGPIKFKTVFAGPREQRAGPWVREGSGRGQSIQGGVRVGQGVSLLYWNGVSLLYWK